MNREFVYDIFTPEEASVIVFGVPLGENSFKSLNSLRKVSQLIEPFDIDKGKNLLEGLKIADIGDIEIEDLNEIFKQTKNIIDKGKVPLALGGKHLLSLYTIKALPENAKLIVFDAHCDSKDIYLGSKFNSATWLRRVCETIGTKNVVLLGVRSCDEEEFDFIRENNILYFTSTQIKNNLEEIKQKLRSFLKNSSVYISIDIDVFDPSVAPATYFTEPNGLLLDEFLELIQEICKQKIIGLDLVEVKPLSENKITEFLAVKVIFEILSLLKR